MKFSGSILEVNFNYFKVRMLPKIVVSDFGVQFTVETNNDDDFLM